MRHEGVMRRAGAWLRARPLARWAVDLALFSALASCILLVPGPHTFGVYFLAVWAALCSPTIILIQRMSPERQRVEPVSSHQKALLGAASCAAAAVGLLAFCAGLLHCVVHLGDMTVMASLMTFAFSTLLALVLGWAARDMRPGRFGAALAVCGFLGVAAAVFVIGLIARFVRVA